LVHRVRNLVRISNLFYIISLIEDPGYVIWITGSWFWEQNGQWFDRS